MEGDCNVYAHSSLWMRPTGEWSINAKMVYSKKIYVYVTDWKAWPKCFLRCVLKCFSLRSKRVKLESVTTLFSVKYGTWFLDEQDTRQSTELKKSVVQSVLLCLSYLFMYILTSKFIKKNGKKLSKQKKIQKLEFCQIKRAPKTECAQRLLRHRIFLALSYHYLTYALN